MQAIGTQIGIKYRSASEGSEHGDWRGPCLRECLVDEAQLAVVFIQVDEHLPFVIVGLYNELAPDRGIAD